jgi:hypothetical protein
LRVKIKDRLFFSPGKESRSKIVEKTIFLSCECGGGKTQVFLALWRLLETVRPRALQTSSEACDIAKVVPETPPQRPLRTHTVARFLGVSPRTVRRYVQRSLINATKGHRLLAFVRTHVEEYLLRRFDRETLNWRLQMWSKDYPLVAWSSL